tara:strand:+ start:93 stop:701 length:609 start_codon:yes stop_codon:yes gene_type:complete
MLRTFDVGLGRKAFMIELKKSHPFLYEHIFFKDCAYGYSKGNYFLELPESEYEKEMPKSLIRSYQERTIWLTALQGIELQIFDVKRYIESHRNKSCKSICYNLDYLTIDQELLIGEWKGFKYDLRDPNASPWAVGWMTPEMSAIEWRKILNAMLCILKKHYREAKAAEKLPKPRKPRRVPFKESMHSPKQGAMPSSEPIQLY